MIRLKERVHRQSADPKWKIDMKSVVAAKHLDCTFIRRRSGRRPIPLGSSIKCHVDIAASLWSYGQGLLDRKGRTPWDERGQNAETCDSTREHPRGVRSAEKILECDHRE